MADLAEVLLPHPDERRPVELRVPADVVVGAGVELAAVLVAPGLLDVVAALGDDRVRVPVLLLAWDVIAPLEEEDALAGRREAVGEGPAPRARADDDHVVAVVRHAPLRQAVVREAAAVAGSARVPNRSAPRATSQSSESGPAPCVPSQTSSAM